MPSAPAVFAMHFFSYWSSKPSAPSRPPAQQPQPALFHNTGEDDLAIIAQYYDVPVLSVR